MKKKMCCVVF